MGPFYCPSDQGIYIDTSFFRELETKYRAAGDFDRDGVVSGEFQRHGFGSPVLAPLKLGAA